MFAVFYVALVLSVKLTNVSLVCFMAHCRSVVSFAEVLMHYWN